MTPDTMTRGPRRGSARLFRTGTQLGIAVSLLAASASGWAHHSYAMFNMSSRRVVHGTVAKIEWANPHVFVWVYVKRQDQAGRYDLYAFENDSVNGMTRLGWTKNTFKPGDAITVEYFPLRDGRTGGELIKAITADGRETRVDPLLPGVVTKPSKREAPAAPGASP